MDRSGSTAVCITASYKCTAVRRDHVINHMLHARPIHVQYMAYTGTPAAIPASMHVFSWVLGTLLLLPQVKLYFYNYPFCFDI